ncbi:transposase [Liquorilactobacillus capillatus]|uniref:transposase n=1 Tax=Liquorilactobacillus capillatus TaxID=480931 RepID=UPI003B82F03E
MEVSKKHFENNCSLSEHRTVKRVVIEFDAQYQSIFPEAKMIANNFHLVQMGLQALNQTRVQLIHHFS